MTLIDACCNTPPTVAKWESKGQVKTLPTLIDGQERQVYRTGPKDSKRGVIAVYDIFGVHPTTLQFFDRVALSQGGFQVSAPYMFKEGAMPESLLKDRPAMMAWMGVHGDYHKAHLGELIKAAVEDLRADGCTHFTIFGQCWGTFIALQAASEEGNPFLAVGGPHPSATNIETVKNITCPLILLPSKDDDDMIPVIESVKHKNFPVECFHKRYENMHHGWTGGRGDWTNPEQFKDGIDAAEVLGQYFAKVIEVAEKNNQ